ncbi:hypothetical protein [Pseudomonas sp. RIT-PI-S]|uniref:hypothetical protein n=1 Tax=Pseudomonas sp. RIT-PI-S TaxID=3035295 RepID=UPI0021D7DAB1|nr:hypothetical protein [Pseudomonas sp. RIT-PI-S]
MPAQDPTLPPVIAELIEAGYLDEVQVPAQGLPATITYSGLEITDQVVVHWYSVATDGRVSDWTKAWTLSPGEPDYDHATGTLRFVLPKMVITPAVGGQAFLNWELRKQRDIEATSSQRLALHVGRLPPVIQVRHSHQLQIAPALSTGNVEVVGPAYTSLRVGDVATLHAIRDPEGSPQARSYQLVIEAKHLGQPLMWQVEKTFLAAAQALKKPVDLYVELSLGGSAGVPAKFARQRYEVVPQLPDREGPVELPGVTRAEDIPEIDPADFPGGLDVLIPLADVVQRGDIVLLRVSTTRGTEDLRIQAIADLTTVKTGYLGVTLPQAWLLANDGQDVTFEWQVDRVGASFSGQPLGVQVQSGRILTWPNVPQATAEGQEQGDFKGFVEASRVTAGLRVEVPADFALRPGEVLSVHYDGDPAGGRYQTSTPISGQERAFFIPAQYLAPNMGGEAKRAPIYYTLQLASGAVMKSPNYQLLVNRLPASALTNIKCPQAPGGSPLSIRDLIASHGGQADVIQPAWLLMAQGQRILVSAIGVSRQDGSELTYTLLDGLASAPDEIATVLPVSFLQQLMLNEQFYIVVKIAFDTKNFMLQKSTPLQLVA